MSSGWVRRITLGTLFCALLATGCVSDSPGDEALEREADQTVVSSPTSISAAVATPTPSVLDDSPAGDGGEGTDTMSEADPWEVSVLTATGDALIVPVFNGADGEEISLYDINEIDDVELEYPLYTTTYFGNPLTLVVERWDSTGDWAEVTVPVRPNGTTAWVQTSFFTESKHNYHISFDVSTNTLKVFRGEELVVEQLAVSGRPERPTPLGRTFIDEMIPGADFGDAYGTWVLSLAAFSTSLGTFGGGTPKLALQGTNEPALMGQYVSSGSIRVPNDIIELIAETVPVGTIVEIHE